MVGPLRSHLLGNPRASRVRYFEHMLISACATPVAISNLVVLVLAGRSIVLRALSVARHRTIVEEHGMSRPIRAAQLNYRRFCAALGNLKASLLST